MPASRRASIRIDRLLGRLESARRERGAQRGVEGVLAALGRAGFRDPERLVLFHDALLYFSAFSSRPSVRRQAESILRTFESRVEEIEDDSGVLEGSEHSGLAGTSVATSFSFDLLRGLSRLRGGALRIDWGLHDAPDRLGAGLPRFLPLLEEEALVDANVPYSAWLDAARKGNAASWLLSRFESLAVSPVERAELFDALALSFRWSLGRSRWSRTHLRIRGGRAFFHGKALLARRDVDLRAEAAGPKLPARRLAPRDGLAALDAARAALAARYREFYVFNHADSGKTTAVDAGRGLRFQLFGLPPARRLPLRGASAFLIVRNGVPIGYGDGFMLFERVDLSFNIFPEYRDGETAFIFARLLRTYRQTFGVTVFSVDPYQIGFENEEAVESGAFWFYRRLGFRSVSPALEALARREDARIAQSRSYRSSARVLRRLASAGMIFDAVDAAGDAWDRFHVRHIGLAVERKMAASGLSAANFRARAAARLARLLPGRSGRRNPAGAAVPPGLACALDLVPGIARWDRADLQALEEIVSAKASAVSEERYVRLLQRHSLLRQALIRFGSRRPPA